MKSALIMHTSTLRQIISATIIIGLFGCVQCVSITRTEVSTEGWPTKVLEVPPNDLWWPSGQTILDRNKKHMTELIDYCKRNVKINIVFPDDCIYLFFVCTDKASGSWPDNKARCTKLFSNCQSKLGIDNGELDYEDSGLLETLLPVNQIGIDEVSDVTENPATPQDAVEEVAPTTRPQTDETDEVGNFPENPENSESLTLVGEEDTGPVNFPVDLIVQNCYDLLANGTKTTGIHSLQIGPTRKDVFCDMQSLGGGWTVIQRRGVLSPNPNPPDFFLKNWTDYQNGFGAPNSELWLGLESIFYLTNKEPMQLLITLDDFEGNRVGLFVNDFRISNEKGAYRIFYNSFSSDLGKSLPARGTKYSTIDRDNDAWSKNCALRFSGAWWYSACHNSNLNGLYLKGQHESFGDGVNWYHWKGYHYSLKSAVMKVRPQRLAPATSQTTTTTEPPQ